MELFEETEGGENGGGDDFFADDGIGNGADPGFFEEVKGHFQRFCENVEDLLHFIDIGWFKLEIKWRSADDIGDAEG